MGFGLMWDWSLDCDRAIEEDPDWVNTPEGQACHRLVQQENERLKAILNQPKEVVNNSQQ